MAEDPTARWPRFELVTFSAPTGIPHGWDAELLSKGVPKAMLGRYNAASELTLLEDPGHGPLVCFGASGSFVRLCLDPRTGQVVDIVYDRKAVNQPSNDHGPPWLVRPPLLVNSTLDQFIDSVHTVVDRFPFHSGDTKEGSELDDPAKERARAEQLDSELDRAAENLTEILRSIDPAAVADESTFWRTFVDDVQMGDFATEDVLRLLSQ